MPIKAAVMGLGNIGRYAIEALEIQPDFTCVGVIRRKESLGKDAHDLRGVPEYASLADLEAVSGKPDVVLLCAPSRKIPEVAGDLLGKGYNTVDSFDIHDRIVETIGLLEAQAVKGKAVAITAAGWDPGTDSVMRALFEAMAPVGVTFTNFGRGRSMGHSVAARAIAGVADATSITIPLGGGRHSRLVYVVLEEGATFEAVKAAIQADPYFSHDPLDVRQVTKDELPRVADASHGVLMERVAPWAHRQPAFHVRHAHRQPGFDRSGPRVQRPRRRAPCPVRRSGAYADRCAARPAPARRTHRQHRPSRLAGCRTVTFPRAFLRGGPFYLPSYGE
ncbi:MAG: diaminopimelate dehydrogenase [Bilophila wadsworthia]